MIKKRLLLVFFSIYIVFIPILQYYKSPIPALNLATFISLIFFVVFLVDFFFNSRKAIKFCWPVTIYVLYIISNSMFNRNIDLFGSATILSLTRFILLFASLFFLGRYYFDVGIAIRALEKILILSSVFALFSTILFYLFGISFRFNIPFLLSDSGYSAFTNRFSGIYMEPAHFAQSAVIYLCYTLFGKEKLDVKRVAKVLLIAFGIVISGSGQGYLFLLIISILYIFYLIFLDKKNKNKFLILSTFLIVGTVGLLIVSRMSFFQNAVSRVISDDGSIGGDALNGRTFSNKLFDTLTNEQKWTGVGFANISTVYTGYFNSLFTHLIETGYISAILLFFIPFWAFIKGDFKIKCLSIIYASMITITACASPMMLCFFLLFILPLKQNKKAKINLSISPANRRLAYD